MTESREEELWEEYEEEHYQKVLGQFRLTMNGLMAPLRLYGQAQYVDSVTKEIEKLAWQLHWKLEGIDIPYEVTDLHW